MKELSWRELLALKEIHLTGQASDSVLIGRLVEEGMIIDIEMGDLLLSHKGRGLLVRGSPSLWENAA